VKKKEFRNTQQHVVNSKGEQRLKLILDNKKRLDESEKNKGRLIRKITHVFLIKIKNHFFLLNRIKLSYKTIKFILKLFSFMFSFIFII
jgi:hypothetical protein